MKLKLQVTIPHCSKSYLDNTNYGVPDKNPVYRISASFHETVANVWGREREREREREPFNTRDDGPYSVFRSGVHPIVQQP